MRHALLALLLLTPAPVLAAEAADLAVANLWARATPPGTTTGVIYLTVMDIGAPDSLTAVNTPVAEKAQLHESKTVNGVSQMRPVDAVPVSAESPLSLAPGGYHIMLEGLKQPLKAGTSFPIILTFAQAGAVNATVEVRSLGAGGHDTSGHDIGHSAPTTTTAPVGH